MTTPMTRKAGMLTGLCLLAPIILAVMGVVVLAPILPQLQQAFKGTPHAEFLVPMILTTPALCVTLFSWAAGALGDAFGRRRLLMGALVFYAIVGVAPAFLNDLRAILVTRVGVGLAEAMLMTLSTALIGDVFEGPTRDRWLGSQTAVASLSALVLFNVGGFLGVYGWRAPFFVYASSVIMLLGVALFTWEPAPDARAKGALHDDDEQKGGWELFPWAPMLGVTAVTVFASVMFYTVQIQASVGLSLHGVTDPRRIGFLTSVASLAVPLGTIVFQFAARWRVATLLAIAFSLLATGFILMKWSSDANQFLIGAAVNQLGAGIVLPTVLTWAMRQLPYPVRGRGMGIWTGAFSLGQFISPIAITLISARMGGLWGAFEALGFACAIAGVAALLGGFVKWRGDAVALV
ncbi:MAG TPA: MFS transporter [Caulobacteraceae bacterium]